MFNPKKILTVLAIAALGAAARTDAMDDSAPSAAASHYADGSPAGASAEASGNPGSARQNYWGFGFGYVFNKIPISMSTFDVLLSNLWYSHVFGDPGETTRIAGTLGLTGFQLLLPVPKASLDMYFGKPTDDIQFKGGVGGFYDITVGGHGGLTGELGVVLKNRVDISFLFVPVGTDSKRSYGEFMGLETEEEAERDRVERGGRYVDLPYYGINVGLRF